MARQDGVVTLDQARDAGMSESAIGRRVRSGEWRRLATGVYLRSDRAHTPSVELRAAVYAAGTGAAASGASAAWWHGLLDRPPARHTVTIPVSRTVVRHSSVRIRRRTLDWRDTESRRALRVTGLPLSVLEAAVDVRAGSVLMDRAIQRHTTLEALAAAHERNARRHGAPAAARLLRAAGEGGASEAERMLHRLLRSAGLTRWRPHVVSCGYEIDVAFVADRVAIEVDGWAWHRDVERFNRDAQRQNTLMNAGWRVLRFTWHHLHNDPEAVLAQIRTALTAGL